MNISIELTFLEPYRLVEWIDRDARKINPRAMRGESFAQWKRKGHSSAGKPFFTGTLMRSAVIKAAEELLSLKSGNWEGVPCCNGSFQTDESEEKKPSFLRKRHTLQWQTNRAVCKPEEISKDEACPFCILLGNFDNAGKVHESYKDYDIHFSNFYLHHKQEKNGLRVEDIASGRILNRVDFDTGKAKDYFRIWEADYKTYSTYTGKIMLQDTRAKELLVASLGFVDKLCGALCRIEVIKESELLLPSDTKEQTSTKDDTDEVLPDDQKNVLWGSAEEIVEAFKQVDKLEKIRILADAVRTLRLHGEDVIEKDELPKDKEDRDKGHHLWDIKIQRTPLRTKLKELWLSIKDKGISWREFTETLGSNLYLLYKEETGGVSSRFRILGDAEYYSKAHEGNETDTFIPVTPPERLITKEWIVVGNLKALTPFYFGVQQPSESIPGDEKRSEDSLVINEHTSFNILLDKKNRYRMPRSVLRGALRRDLRTAFGNGCNVNLGGQILCNCKVCIEMRRITLKDSVSDFSEEQPPPEIRYRIEKNPNTATVNKGSLFDLEVGPEGLTFPFVLRYRGYEFPKQLSSVIRYWKGDEKGMAWLGGFDSTGKGRFALGDIKIFEWDLNKELSTYINEKGLRGEEDKLAEDTLPPDILKTLNEIELPAVSDGYDDPYENNLKPLWTEVSYTLDVGSPLLTADTISALVEPGNRDAIAYKKRIYNYQKKKFELRFAVKSETHRGIFRTAIGRRTGDLGKEDHEDCTCDMCSIFGNEHEASKIRFEDLELINGNEFEKLEKHIDHVAIDRFTGGAVDKAKFDTYPLAGSPKKPLKLKGRFWIKKGISDDHKSLIATALYDIRDGLYPLGSKGGVGYGWVTNLAILNSQNGFTISERQEVESVDKTNYDYSKTLPPLLNLKPDNIYYPHYFLKPSEYVNREHRLIGHDQYYKEFENQDEDIEKLVSGRIECTLETLKPLIMPDTESEDAFGLMGEFLDHKNHKFFRINGEEMITGSKIRGMVSSVYEAITNSCFRVFDEKRYLSRRIDPENQDLLKRFVPGMVKIENGKLFVQKIEEEYRLPLYDDPKAMDNFIVEDYIKNNKPREQKIRTANECNKNIANVASINSEYLKGHSDMQNVLKGKIKVKFKEVHINRKNPNDKVAAQLDNSGDKEGFIKFSGLNMVNISNISSGTRDEGFDEDWDIWSLNITLNGMRLRNSQKQEYPRPFLGFKRDGKEYKIDKRCERLFITPDSRKKPYEVSRKVQSQYNDVLKDYEKNFGHIDKRFKTLVNNCTLDDGNLVYFIPDEQNRNVSAITPVKISRITDNKPQGKRLPDESDNLRPCERDVLDDDVNPDSIKDSSIKKSLALHPDGLCPSCHLFGTTSYKGRVQFGFAKLEGEPKWIDNGKSNPDNNTVTLPLLERPRPTWSMPSNKYEVPGRKFYLHHDGWKDVLGNQEKLIKDRNRNNRTVEAMNDGNRFKFKINFENLREWELGLLLYSLELQPGMGHKLGMGKPLGFGSVKIDVNELKTFVVKKEEEKRDDALPEWNSHNDQIDNYIGQSMKKLNEWFGKEWYELEHINNLHSLLRIPEDDPNTNPESKYKVKYPALNVESKGYIESSDYTYKKLGDKDKLSYNARVKGLTIPWHSWNPFQVISEHEDQVANVTSNGPSTMDKVEGTVKWFNADKKFGFINKDDGEDVFVHLNSIKGGVPLKEGERVTFSVTKADKGLKAGDVERAG